MLWRFPMDQAMAWFQLHPLLRPLPLPRPSLKWDLWYTIHRIWSSTPMFLKYLGEQQIQERLLFLGPVPCQSDIPVAAVILTRSPVAQAFSKALTVEMIPGGRKRRNEVRLWFMTILLWYRVRNRHAVFWNVIFYNFLTIAFCRWPNHVPMQCVHEKV